MCTYNLSFNDALMERVRPIFPSEDAVTQWMQEQMSLLLVRLAAQQEQTEKPKEHLSVRLRGIASVPKEFDYKQELANRIVL